MGSSGSGSFTDYSEHKSDRRQGGDSGEDRCMNAFSTLLDEVARSSYYIRTGGVPPVGTEITVILKGRLQIITADDEDIGYLPTKFNYLASCIGEGYTYSGQVISSTTLGLPSIQVDIVPHEP